MKKILLIGLIALILPVVSFGATEQDKQAAIDSGLAYLASTMTVSGSEGYFTYGYDGTLAATASAALAFIEEGYLPGDGSIYGTQVQQMCNYIFNRATSIGVSTEMAGTGAKTYASDPTFEHNAEDYNNNMNYTDDGGNGQAIYFNPGAYNRNVYTTGLVAPVVYALGEALGKTATVGMGTVTNSMTYGQVMQDVVDWFSYGQVEPNRGSYRGGWRYDANWPDADNSTAQWGALPLLYAQDWGLGVPGYVYDELALWTDVVQNNNGGSGYNNDLTYVNESKTGGLLLEFAALGYGIGVDNSTGDWDGTHAPWNTIGNEVDAALAYLDTNWNNGPSGTWYGNIGHPYAMWAIYKGLEVYGIDTIPSAPGGFTVGQDWDPQTSSAGDWFAHYCDWLVNNQNPDGSWNGYSYWTGALSAGWYINILNAAGAPPPQENPVPEPATVVLFGLGLLGILGLSRRKRI